MLFSFVLKRLERRVMWTITCRKAFVHIQFRYSERVLIVLARQYLVALVSIDQNGMNLLNEVVIW